ncbi:MAG: molybdopterin dinucleotide binding domain-containing protein, partial [Acidiferrobacterales bacterium]
NELEGEPDALTRICEVPIYRVDGMVRRSPALQETADNPPPAAHLNPASAASLGLQEATQVTVRTGQSEAVLDLVIDPRVPDKAVLIPVGYPETAALNARGKLTVVRTEDE